MFLGRLNDAKAEAKSDFRPLPAKSAPVEHANFSGAQPAPPKDEAEGDDGDIVERVSEFLFDIFDANLMDEYKEIERFEGSAERAFVDSATEGDGDEDVEFTHEQYALHSQFAALFERLTEQFLAKEGFTPERFYEVVRRQQRAEKADAEAGRAGDREWGEKGEVAHEVIDVVSEVSDIRVWAKEMRRRVRHRRQFDPKWSEAPQ